MGWPWLDSRCSQSCSAPALPSWTGQRKWDERLWVGWRTRRDHSTVTALGKPDPAWGTEFNLLPINQSNIMRNKLNLRTPRVVLPGPRWTFQRKSLFSRVFVPTERHFLAEGEWWFCSQFLARPWWTSALQVNEISILFPVDEMLLLWRLECNELAVYYN